MVRAGPSEGKGLCFSTEEGRAVWRRIAIATKFRKVGTQMRQNGQEQTKKRRERERERERDSSRYVCM